jgi:hypothetical protein
VTSTSSNSPVISYLRRNSSSAIAVHARWEAGRAVEAAHIHSVDMSWRWSLVADGCHESVVSSAAGSFLHTASQIPVALPAVAHSPVPHC